MDKKKNYTKGMESSIKLIEIGFDGLKKAVKEGDIEAIALEAHLMMFNTVSTLGNWLSKHVKE